LGGLSRWAMGKRAGQVAEVTAWLVIEADFACLRPSFLQPAAPS
jgi:hypothetical protein